MSVKIEIFGEDASQALVELKTFSGGLSAAAADAQMAVYADAAGAVVSQAIGDAKAEAPKRRGRAPKAEAEQRNITNSPEDRTNPEIEESTEAAQQDAADEKAESEAKRSAPVTIEDVRAAMSNYVKAYGMPATQEDGPKIFQSAVGNPPAGEPYWKLSLLTGADAATLGKVVAAWTSATTENTYKRDLVA